MGAGTFEVRGQARGNEACRKTDDGIVGIAEDSREEWVVKQGIDIGIVDVGVTGAGEHCGRALT
jgi:hypothetical protein